MQDLATGLQARGWSVAVACDPGCAAARALVDAGVRIASLNATRQPSLHDGAALWRLMQIVRRERPGLIHAHSSKAGLLAGVAGRALGVPTIYTPHGWSFEMQAPVVVRTALATTEALLARTTHRAVIAVCGSERRAALRWHVARPDAMVVVRTGRASSSIPLERREMRALLGIDPLDDTVVVAWIGRTGPQKGAGGLPALARRLAAHGVVLAALGEGLDSTGIAGAVTAAGGIAVPPSLSADALLTASDALVSTSAWEGLPLVVIEALEHGLPIVAYDVGGLSEQVIEGENGHLVPAGAADLLANRLLEIGHRPEVMRRLGHASRQLWAERFRPEAMLDRTELAYAHVLRTQHIGRDRVTRHLMVSRARARRPVRGHRLRLPRR